VLVDRHRTTELVGVGGPIVTRVGRKIGGQKRRENASGPNEPAIYYCFTPVLDTRASGWRAALYVSYYWPGAKTSRYTYGRVEVKRITKNDNNA